MDYRKLVLYVALIIVALSLWNLWQREHDVQTNSNSEVASIGSLPSIPQAQSSTTPKPNNMPSVPSSVEQRASSPSSTPSLISNKANLIKVTTDKFILLIDKKGGNIIKSALAEYGQEKNKSEPFVLLNTDPQELYSMQSGLIGKEGPDTQQGQVTYSSSKNEYTLAPDSKELTVDLTWKNVQGFSLVKRYSFKRDEYKIAVLYKIDNASTTNWTVYPYAQFQRKEPPKQSALFHYGLFTGAAISSPDKHYQKISFEDMKTSPLNQNITDGWAAMVQHYFLSSWVPPKGENYHYYSSYTQDDLYTIGLMGPALSIAPHQNNVTTELTLYMGPAIAEHLNAVAPNLSLTIDYGWLWFISAALFWVMSFLYKFLGNWGWSIVILTLLIKLCFYHLSAKSYTSMAHMRRLQPRMQQLKERFADDKQKLSQAIMEMYRAEKVNPLSGCLPILIQIPFFISLYYMIIESVELRQAPFMLWIHDLSVADPFYILPVIMGGLMFVQQKLNPPAPDPMQQKIMLFLPVIFTVFFLNFPAGLVLYWITNTALSILQQAYIMRKVNKAEG